MSWCLRIGCVLLIPFVAVACSGNPPPEVAPVEEVVELPPPVDDSAERAEAAARQLCDRASSAMDDGDYGTALRLLRQAVDDYPGTTCAESAPEQIERAITLDALTARIHFGFNLSEITDEAAEVLQRKADEMRDHPEVTLRIEGHCDERGSLEYNQALGLRRAQAALEYMTNLGISADRLEVVTFGEERPLTQGSNESAWRQNRRDEFVITAGDI